MNVGGRNAREQLRLEQGHQPVAGLLGFHFLDFDTTRDAIVSADRAVQAEQLFEQAAAHAQYIGLGFCDGRHLPGLKLCQRLKGSAFAAANSLDEGPVGKHFEVAVEHIEGEIVAVALPEEGLFLA